MKDTTINKKEKKSQVGLMSKDDIKNFSFLKI